MAIDKTPEPRRTPVPPVRSDDRAQPGDVLGLERDGETTSLGDTREDEDERREVAEDAARRKQA
jgi:hypothetical protein